MKIYGFNTENVQKISVFEAKNGQKNIICPLHFEIFGKKMEMHKVIKGKTSFFRYNKDAILDNYILSEMNRNNRSESIIHYQVKNFISKKINGIPEQIIKNDISYRIADVYVKSKNEVHEIQISYINLQVLIDRTNDYKNSRVKKVIWYLNDNMNRDVIEYLSDHNYEFVKLTIDTYINESIIWFFPYNSNQKEYFFKIQNISN